MNTESFVDKNNETQKFDVFRKDYNIYEVNVQDRYDSKTKGIACINNDWVMIYNSEGKFIEEYSILVDIEDTYQARNVVFEKIAENTLIAVFNDRLKDMVSSIKTDHLSLL